MLLEKVPENPKVNLGKITNTDTYNFITTLGTNKVKKGNVDDSNTANKNYLINPTLFKKNGNGGGYFIGNLISINVNANNSKDWFIFSKPEREISYFISKLESTHKFNITEFYTFVKKYNNNIPIKYFDNNDYKYKDFLNIISDKTFFTGKNKPVGKIPTDDETVDKIFKLLIKILKYKDPKKLNKLIDAHLTSSKKTETNVNSNIKKQETTNNVIYSIKNLKKFKGKTVDDIGKKKTNKKKKKKSNKKNKKSKKTKESNKNEEKKEINNLAKEIREELTNNDEIDDSAIDILEELLDVVSNDENDEIEVEVNDNDTDNDEIEVEVNDSDEIDIEQNEESVDENDNNDNSSNDSNSSDDFESDSNSNINIVCDNEENNMDISNNEDENENEDEDEDENEEEKEETMDEELKRRHEAVLAKNKNNDKSLEYFETTNIKRIIHSDTSKAFSDTTNRDYKDITSIVSALQESSKNIETETIIENNKKKKKKINNNNTDDSKSKKSRSPSPKVKPKAKTKAKVKTTTSKLKIDNNLEDKNAKRKLDNNKDKDVSDSKKRKTDDHKSNIDKKNRLVLLLNHVKKIVKKENNIDKQITIQKIVNQFKKKIEECQISIKDFEDINYWKEDKYFAQILAPIFYVLTHELDKEFYGSHNNLESFKENNFTFNVINNIITFKVDNILELSTKFQTINNEVENKFESVILESFEYFNVDSGSLLETKHKTDYEKLETKYKIDEFFILWLGWINNVTLKDTLKKTLFSQENNKYGIFDIDCTIMKNLLKDNTTWIDTMKKQHIDVNEHSTNFIILVLAIEELLKETYDKMKNTQEIKITKENNEWAPFDF